MLSPVPDTDCMRAREDASARLDGELGELDRARLEAHLADCPECAAFAASLDLVARTMRDTALEPAPAALFVPQRRRAVPVPPRFVAAAAATIVVAAAAGSSFFLGQVVGAHGAGHGRTVVTAAGRPEPGLVAMVRTRHSWPSQNRRAVAL